MKRKFIIIIVILAVIVFILGGDFYKNRVQTVKKQDSYFSENVFVEYNENIISNKRDAVKIAKVAIQSFYQESLLLHGPYQVFDNQEQNRWEIKACGVLHGDAYVVIDKKTGAILKIVHTKF